jgi:hypothetical protein
MPQCPSADATGGRGGGGGGRGGGGGARASVGVYRASIGKMVGSSTTVTQIGPSQAFQVLPLLQPGS